MSLADALRAEFDRRRATNVRYSLRAFARALGVSHSSLSRLVRGQRPSVRAIAALGPRLGWSDAHVRDTVARRRVDVLRALAGTRGFVADARWIAARTGLSLDHVQIALHDAVRTRRLSLSSTRVWTAEA